MEIQNDTIPFVKTRLAARIWQTIDYARKYNKFTFVFGESQIGKTEAIKAYCGSRPHAHYVRMPAAPTHRTLASRISTVLGGNPKLTFPQQREFICSRLSSRDVLVIDEMHQILLGAKIGGEKQKSIIEFVREIYDATNCGICICSTDIFEKAIENSELSGVLEQSVRRSLVRFHAPKKPSDRDLQSFAEQFGLPAIPSDAKAVQNEVVSCERLGVWLTILRMARGIAINQSRDVTWDDVVLAHKERELYNAK